MIIEKHQIRRCGMCRRKLLEKQLWQRLPIAFAGVYFPLYSRNGRVYCKQCHDRQLPSDVASPLAS